MLSLVLTAGITAVLTTYVTNYFSLYPWEGLTFLSAPQAKWEVEFGDGGLEVTAGFLLSNHGSTDVSVIELHCDNLQVAPGWRRSSLSRLCHGVTVAGEPPGAVLPVMLKAAETRNIVAKILVVLGPKAREVVDHSFDANKSLSTRDRMHAALRDLNRAGIDIYDRPVNGADPACSGFSLGAGTSNGAQGFMFWAKTGREKSYPSPHFQLQTVSACF